MANNGKQVSAENEEVGSSSFADQSSNSSSSSAITSSSIDSEQSSVNLGVDGMFNQFNDDEAFAMQWLHALDYQVTGACRVDERIKPLLKLNASSGAAEERLLLHLNQHFETREIGRLARCLCVPLVCIRVGKVIKHGNILRPTAIRGNLKLMLLPTSDNRVLFMGDDGSMEILYTIRRSDCSLTIQIEDIDADNSGRSFSIKTSDNLVHFFWCCGKSKLLGEELLSKMKDLLKRKPSVSELTGISEVSLDSFATHLNAYIVAISPEGIPSITNMETAPGCTMQGSSAMLSSSMSYCGTQIRSSAPPRRLPLSVQEKHSDEAAIDVSGLQLNPASSSLGSIVSQAHTRPASALSPHYCWCPPFPSTIQSLPCGLVALPPLTSLPPLGLTQVTASEILTFSAPLSQQIPLFTPLMCDPIVHIPMIEVCSSGQSYLVSTTPMLSSSIAPLLSETDSLEKSALETLARLISSNNQIVPRLADIVVPLTSASGDQPMPNLLAMGSRGFYQDVLVQAATSVAMGIIAPETGNFCEADNGKDSSWEDLDGTG